MLRRILALLAILAAVPAGAGVVRSSTNVSGGSGGTYTGGAITSPILAPDGTSVAPAYSFANDSALGMYNYGASTVAFAKSGSVFFRAAITGMVFNDNATVIGEAAHVLALRSGTNAQTFNWYYSYTDASNYQRGALKTSASGIEIAAETAGSGADNLDITLTPAGSGKARVSGTSAMIAATGAEPFSAGTTGGNNFYLISNNLQRFLVDYNGSFGPALDDTYAFGRTTFGIFGVRSVGVTRAIEGSKTKTLTDGAAAAAFVRIAVPQTVGSNYAGGDVIWTAFAADATPHTQSLSGRLTFTAINNAGTEVCAVDPTAAVTAPNANSSGTLQCTFSCASNAADTIDLMATCDTSLGTPTALSLLYRLDMPQPNTVTPQ